MSTLLMDPPGVFQIDPVDTRVVNASDMSANQPCHIGIKIHFGRRSVIHDFRAASGVLANGLRIFDLSLLGGKEKNSRLQSVDFHAQSA